ncbi:MAG TPA: AraC family transcriptional regulator [Candidatus Angelobacter sp.]
MGAGMVTAITARILIDECAGRGLDCQKLRAGISSAQIDDVLGFVPVETMYTLWDRALQISGDQMLGARTAEKVPFGAYRLLDYMLATSATPRDALKRSSRYFELMNTAFVLSWRLCNDLAYLELSSRGIQCDLPRPYVEYILINYLSRLRFATQTNLSPSEVHCTYGQPSLLKEYNHIFSAPVRFHQPVNRLVFARHLLDRPHRLADPELCELLEGQAMRKLVSLHPNHGSLEEIQRVLAENLEMGTTTLASVSRQLAKSSRSLQREIHSQGKSFRELLDSVRQKRAQQLLCELDLSLGDVAGRLHFADASSFCRAFQRWTGKSPAEYRRLTHSG